MKMLKTKQEIAVAINMHEMHPTATIGQIREMITDKRQFIFDPEAAKVCDDYIKAGCANNVPNWR